MNNIRILTKGLILLLFLITLTFLVNPAFAQCNRFIDDSGLNEFLDSSGPVIVFRHGFAETPTARQGCIQRSRGLSREGQVIINSLINSKHYVKGSYDFAGEKS